MTSSELAVRGSSSIVATRARRQAEQNKAAEMLGARVFAEQLDAYTQAIVKLDDQGWSEIQNFLNKDFEFEQIKTLAKKARSMTRENPLLKRGAAARAAWIFGRGAPIEGDIKPRFQSVIDDVRNREVLFDLAAQVTNEHTLFNSGTYIVVYDQDEKVFWNLSIQNISNIWRNPARPSEHQYYLYENSYQRVSNSTGASETVHEKYWIPLDTYAQGKGVKLEDRISDIPVRKTLRAVTLKVNGDTESVMGIPDCLAAMPWAWAYAEAVRDGVKLNKALSMIAWFVKNKTADAAKRTGAKVVSGNGEAGGFAVGTEGMELTSMPKGNSIDLTTMRPVASMAATAMELSTVAVLSDSGAASGSNAAESTLDAPTQKAMETRQLLWAGFYKRIFRVMGIPEASLPTLNFPKVAVDPVQRYLSSLMQADEHGLLSDLEVRAAVMEALDIIGDATKIPKRRRDYNKQLEAKATPAPAASGDEVPTSVPSQGNTGAGASAADNDSRETQPED